jgi:DNA phosphorothioation-associated putative methyltransferase
VFEANLSTLQPLIDFLTERGRLPHEEELQEAGALVERFGSLRKAFSLVRRVTGSERWSDFEARSRQDCLVYLALAAFNGRPRFGQLPPDLQYDTKDLFGSYKEAITRADKLLFSVGNQEAIDLACRAATVGKLTPQALYVHVSGLSRVSSLLRVYVGCAEALTGRIDEATILKIHRLKPQVSFLVYPTFDKEPHPCLSASFVSRLRDQTVTYRNFEDRDNPPLLHRKETFVPEDYPRREKFQRLTRQEDRAGLLSDPSIGTREGWDRALVNAGLALHGHRLVSAKE